MITSPAFAGKRYAVLGLARSGAATVRSLLASGASVTAWDTREEARAPFLPELARGGGPSAQRMVEGQDAEHPAAPNGPSTAFGGAPPRAKLGEELTLADPLAIDLAGFDGIVVSPGVSLNTHPIAAHARAAGVPVIGDIELFALARPTLPPHKVVGITGTNGKSTTTALIHHICTVAGLPATLGGNIGLPILGQQPLPEGGVYVLELSSFQIDLTHSLDCDVAVLTNITPDHLDRYDGFDAYAAAKARLFAMLRTGVAVIAVEDEKTRAIADTLDAPAQAGAHAERGTGLPPSREHKLVQVRSADIADQSAWPALQGPHNAQNAACAVAAARALGIGEEAVAEGLATFPGLPHRMERIAEAGGVLYVNDSKATNATSAAPALAAYPKVHWILGGRRKTDDLDACAPHFGHVVHAYTIGEATDLFADILDKAGLPVTRAGTLEAAVRAAADRARPGETVLLSPACASYDQFTDYEARGDSFRALVHGIIGATAGGDRP